MFPNRKLIIAIIITFILTISYQVLAAWSLGPYGNYPNPGHHPGQIGPGVFNGSGNLNPTWTFPGTVNITDKICIGGDCVDKLTTVFYNNMTQFSTSSTNWVVADIIPVSTKSSSIFEVTIYRANCSGTNCGGDMRVSVVGGGTSYNLPEQAVGATDIGRDYRVELMQSNTPNKLRVIHITTNPCDSSAEEYDLPFNFEEITSIKIEAKADSGTVYLGRRVVSQIY